MPDFSARAMKKQLDTVLAIVQSLSVALDRVEAAQREQDDRIKALEARNEHRLTLNGQRRTAPRN